MPIDASIPLGVKQYSPLSTLGDVANTANSLQSLKNAQLQNQISQQEYQGNTYKLNQSNQVNNEFNAKKEFYANPDNWQTKGEIDFDKLNANLPKIAPTTAMDDIKKLSDLSTAQTGAKQALQGFDTSTRSIVGGVLGILGRSGKTDKEFYHSELDNLQSNYPNDKNIAKYVENAKRIVDISNPAMLPKLAITESQSLLSPSEQQQLSPTTSLVSDGRDQHQLIAQPSVGGNLPMLNDTGQGIQGQLPVSANETTVTDATGNLNVLRKDNKGNITGINSIPNNQAPPQFVPKGESVATLPEVQQIRTEANSAAANVPQMHNNAQNIIKLADEIPKGSFGQTLNKISSMTGFVFNGDDAAKSQQLQHYMSLQTQAAAKAMGANTDQARNSAESAAGGNGLWNPEAIKSTAKVFDAYTTGLDKYNTGLESYLNSSQNDKGIWGARAFKNAWSSNFDPVVMQLLNAKQNNDKDEYIHLLENNKSDINLIKKVKNIKLLSQGIIPHE